MTVVDRSSGNTLRQQFDVLLLDLDGTVYQGNEPIVGAVDFLRGGDEKQFFVTNNASRSPAAVAHHLVDLGFETSEEYVVTSAQVAARMLAERIPGGSEVVVVGTESLADEISRVGLLPTRSAEGSPVAVVQGHNVGTDWAILAEAVFAIRGGALWVATNTDVTLPTERGLAPGNGAMVAAVEAATGKRPLVAGKPASPIMRDAIRLSSAKTPLAVGDRLDTDIAGANATGIASLLVLSGVSSALDAVRAVRAERPTYIGLDLDVLNRDPSVSAVGPKKGWSASIESGVLTVVADTDGTPNTLDGVLAAAHASWTSLEDWQDVRVRGEGTDELERLLAP